MAYAVLLIAIQAYN